MGDNNFVHLHTHTEYSLLDGINRVNTLPQYIKDMGMNAVAITDHGNVSGSFRFFKECKKVNIKPIIGMEAYYTVNDRTVREVDDLERPYYHLILIALNNTGLHNLFKLSSFSYTEGMYRKPRVDDALLGDFSEGICATTACLGSRISQLILNNNSSAAEILVDHHAALFGNRFVVELQLHEGEEQQAVNKALIKIASKRDLPIIITNDCHYTCGTDKALHEAALCMQTRTTLSNPKRFTFGDIDVHVANHDWMRDRSQSQGLSYEGISNTVALADMVDADSYFTDRKNRYPKFKGLPDGITSWETLERVAKFGLYKRFSNMPPQEYKDRLDKELVAIKRMGFSDYLLIVWEFLNGARSEGVWVGPGRGSAAGSLVAWALQITEVDPIKYGLIFERFLNIGRAATPIIFSDEMFKELPDNNGRCSSSVNNSVYS